MSDETTEKMSEKKTVANFDRVATVYRWAEYALLGRALERTRTQLLAYVAGCRCALVLGDGDGRFTAALMDANAEVQVLALDRSAAMLALLRGNAGPTPRLRTMQADALRATPPKDTDLIVTHFLLDCMTQEEVDALALRLGERVEDGALWLLSEFRVPGGLMGPPAWLYVRGLYFAFRVLTGLRVTRLPDYEGALLRAGFSRTAVHNRLGGMLTSQLWMKRNAE